METESEAARRQAAPPISAVLTDVDGTLVTKDKVLTTRAREAVQSLRDRGIAFTITSGRPPFGMESLVEPLGLTMPMAAVGMSLIEPWPRMTVAPAIAPEAAAVAPLTNPFRAGCSR